ncbi:hypothetical protein ACFFK0_00915 [Paenibacillus chartarius]|uniref:Uncharacterized protein n=1 Tax=Paenibacillus chartarius TaxID=747481 RepID=A0ABV6DEE5_9BACL
MNEVVVNGFKVECLADPVQVVQFEKINEVQLLREATLPQRLVNSLKPFLAV